MANLKIVKTYVTNSKGTMKVAWNVVENDGFVVETFSLKRDAAKWLKNTK